MATTRFDPEAGKDYGKCADCGLGLATKESARDHMSETFEAARRADPSRAAGHSISILNPDRASRIRNEVATIVDDAIADAVENIARLTDSDHVTEDEITSALAFSYDGFSNAWSEYLAGD